MFESIAPALFGLLGTLVGGALTLWQYRVQGRESRRLEAERRSFEQQDKWREIRREAAIAFVHQVDRLTESARELSAATSAKKSEDERRTIIDAYTNDWRTLATGFAAFQLAVTRELNSPAVDLYSAVTDYSVAVDELVDGRRVPAKVERAQDAVMAARRAFIAAAQHQLNSPIAPPTASTAAA